MQDNQPASFLKGANPSIPRLFLRRIAHTPVMDLEAHVTLRLCTSGHASPNPRHAKSGSKVQDMSNAELRL